MRISYASGGIILGLNQSLEDAILTVMDKISDDSGLVPIEELYRKLSQEYNINRVEAGMVLIELHKLGRIHSPRYYHLKKLE